MTSISFIKLQICCYVLLAISFTNTYLANSSLSNIINNNKQTNLLLLRNSNIHPTSIKIDRRHNFVQYTPSVASLPNTKQTATSSQNVHPNVNSQQLKFPQQHHLISSNIPHTNNSLFYTNSQNQILAQHLIANQQPTNYADQQEARGMLARGLNARRSAANSSSSWHFPKINTEAAAEVLLSGAQLVNRLAAAESPLNACKTPDNEDGECSDIRRCIWLVLDKQRLKQSVCLRNLIIPAVCCPLSATNASLANAISASLEPLLHFKPKQPASPFFANSQSHNKPNSNSNSLAVNRSLVVAPAPSVASLVVRGQQQNHTLLNLWPSPSSVAAVSSSLPSSTTTTQAPQQLTTSTTTTTKPYTSPTTNFANETCGESGKTRTSRIVGGSDSKLGQWPWMSAMYLAKHHNSAPEFWCGGALISKRYVLTAAHCLSDARGNKYSSDQVTVKLGGVDLVKHQAPRDLLTNSQLEHGAAIAPSSGSSLPSKAADEPQEEFSLAAFIAKALGLSSSSSSPSPLSVAKQQKDTKDRDKQRLAAHANKTYFKEYQVASVVQHPKFQRHGFYNDIGLIELRSDVDYNELIGPICLPQPQVDSRRDLAGYVGTVLGWGTTSYGGHGSKLLQQVSMPIWTNAECDARYQQQITRTFLCAGFASGGKDACQGDSGGPLMIGDSSGRWTLHGVVSFGKQCAQASYPGVYTRVSEYIEWIQSNTNN